MERHEYDLMYALEDSHWWFQSRLMMIEALMGRHLPAPGWGDERARLLDLGCGTGMFLQRRAGEYRVAGLDFSGQALGYCARRGVRTVCRGDAQQLPHADEAFDVVTAFDLIEHVADDRRLVAEAWRVLRPGGALIATVPAHPALWSAHDISLHHYRRYRRAEFAGLFEDEAWERVRLTYGFGLVFGPAAVVRLSRRVRVVSEAGEPHSDTRPLPGWLNGVLRGVHRAEAACLRWLDLPWGVSLMTVMRKRG